MATLENYLSLPQTTKESNEVNIKDAQEWIKSHYEDALTDSYTAENLASEASDLSIFLKTKTIMRTPQYKAYEESGKKVSYADFVQ